MIQKDYCRLKTAEEKRFKRGSEKSIYVAVGNSLSKEIRVSRKIERKLLRILQELHKDNNEFIMPLHFKKRGKDGI